MAHKGPMQDLLGSTPFRFRSYFLRKTRRFEKGSKFIFFRQESQPPYIEFEGKSPCDFDENNIGQMREVECEGIQKNLLVGGPFHDYTIKT